MYRVLIQTKADPDTTSPLLLQVAEDVAGDDRAVGVRWHVEIDGNIFPFSRGVSFYEMNSDGKILRARDVVEGAVKPGTGALQVGTRQAPDQCRVGMH